ILRNKIGSLPHLGGQTHYEMKHSATSLYNTLYPAAAYTAAAAAYSMAPPPAAIQQVSQAPPAPPAAPVTNVSSGPAPGKANTPSPPVSGSTCAMGTMRPHWPSSHSVSDLLGHVNMAGLSRHHHMQDANNYNYYMYLHSGSQQNNPLTHNGLPNHLSSSFANGFSNPLGTPLSNGLTNGFPTGLSNGLTNGLQNTFSSPLSSMMGSTGLTPQTATL
ncbi:hypothetical protein SK128_020691, partial [Halocaridina rubra]